MGEESAFGGINERSPPPAWGRGTAKRWRGKWPCADVERYPLSIRMMIRVVAAVLALVLGVNGLVMLFAGRWWYGAVPRFFYRAGVRRR